MTELSSICLQLFKHDHSVERLAHLAPYEEEIGDKKLFRVIGVASPTGSINLTNLKGKMHVEVFYDSSSHLYYICKKRKWKDVLMCPPSMERIVSALINKERHYKRMNKKLHKICCE